MKTVLKRLGFAGFLFFLIKSLLWLIIPAVLTGWAILKEPDPLAQPADTSRSERSSP